MPEAPEVTYIASSIKYPDRLGIDAALIVGVAVCFLDGSAPSVAEWKWIASRGGVVTPSIGESLQTFQPHPDSANNVRAHLQRMVAKSQGEACLWIAAGPAPADALASRAEWDTAAGFDDAHRLVLREAAALQGCFESMRSGFHTAQLRALLTA